MKFKFFRNTTIAGLLLLVPVFFLVYVLGQLFLISRKLAVPVMEALGIESILGFLLLNVLAIAGLVALFFLAGLAARYSIINTRAQQLDQALSQRVPVYSMAKGILGGVVQDETSVENMRPVLVQLGAVQRMGFEIERIEGAVVVFLPNVPNVQTGIAIAAPLEDVTRVDLPPHRVIEMLQFFGKGLGPMVMDLIETGPQVDAATDTDEPQNDTGSDT